MASSSGSPLEESAQQQRRGRQWGDGFDIEGSNNVVAANNASANGDDGFDVAGQQNLLTGNIAETNVGGGLEAEGSSNLFYGNTANGNDAAGFEVYGGKNKLTGNVATANGGGGFLVVGSQNALIGNRSGENAGFGFQIVGNKNSIDGSFAVSDAEASRPTGIKTPSRTASRRGRRERDRPGLRRHQELRRAERGHHHPDGYDLKDENPVCSNEWPTIWLSRASRSATDSRAAVMVCAPPRSSSNSRRKSSRCRPPQFGGRWRPTPYSHAAFKGL
jgi:parallel beta-helix repeat protein